MVYFLAKTDPETYSINDLQRDGETIWDGVHNYQAINYIKSWKIGDRVFLYHSQDEKKIVGLMEVVGEPYKDLHDKRNISWVAKVRFRSRLPEEKQVSLKEIKESGLFSDFLLVTHSRLSVMPCPPDFITWMDRKNNK